MYFVFTSEVNQMLRNFLQDWNCQHFYAWISKKTNGIFLYKKNILNLNHVGGIRNLFYAEI